MPPQQCAFDLQGPPSEVDLPSSSSAACPVTDPLPSIPAVEQQQQQQSDAKSKKKKWKISFCTEENTYHSIPHLRDLSKNQVRSTWYDRTEFQAMRVSFVPVIKKMMKGESVEETDQETVRGLEYRTRDGALRRQHNKLHSIHAVLDEQERQYRYSASGQINRDLLSEVYQACTIHCAAEAHSLGLHDEEEARRLLAEPSGGGATSPASRCESGSGSCVQHHQAGSAVLESPTKAVMLVGKLFKHAVRIRRRPLPDEFLSRNHPPIGMPQAA